MSSGIRNLLIAGVFAMLALPAAAQAQEAKDQAGKSQGRKSGVIRMEGLTIEGERETPNVIIIQEWTPPKDQKVEDKASDDLDRVFTSIRSLNRQFDGELKETEDAQEISEEAQLREEEQELLDEERPTGSEQRTRKTSLR